jgi:RNA polymerase primary sigma factor
MLSLDQDLPLGALEQYRREVNRIDPLTSEEERRLLRHIEQGQEAQQAYTRLIEGYLPLVWGIARRYARSCRELDLLDLVQEGNLGLLQACKNFDGSKCGSSFSMWAYSWVRGMIRCALLREGAIRLPLRKAKAVRRMREVNKRLYAVLGHEPTLEETAREMGVTLSQVHELVILQEQRIVSLHAPVDEDGEILLEEVIADPSASVDAEDEFTSVEDVLGRLTDLEGAVMKLRYGVEDGQPRTQREVAELLGLKLSTVQMIDGRAKRRLRRSLVA